jgi:predicted transglutaminase-like cysteine proteinase
MMQLVRRASAMVLSGLIVCAALGAKADTGVPDVSMLPGWKAIASTKWDVKTSGVKNWREMLTRWADGKECASDTCSSSGWAAMVAQVKAAGDVPAQAKVANRLINDTSQHPYVEDINNWGVAEYWETPYEFLKKSGDAEDFAITKYFLLKASGVPVADMQIILVRIKTLGGIGHAILAVRPDSAHTLILDNRMAAAVDASVLKNSYQPALGINDDSWCVYLPQK